MGEKPNPSFTDQAPLFYHELSYVRLLLMMQVQISVGALHRDRLGSYGLTRGHQQVWANNSRLKRARDIGVVSLCLYFHDESTDMHYDLFGSTFELCVYSVTSVSRLLCLYTEK